MQTMEPRTELDSRYGVPGATPTSWADGRAMLASAELYWLSTVRPDGRPHVTPVIAVWVGEALYFCTGAHERKAKNLRGNRNCAITTGCNAMNQGMDLVLEGEAHEVHDDDLLRQVAAMYKRKYDWDFTVRDGEFYGVGAPEAPVILYQLSPAAGFAFGKAPSSQTRWLF